MTTIKDISATIKQAKAELNAAKEELKKAAQVQAQKDAALLKAVVAAFVFKNKIDGKGKYNIKSDSAVPFLIKGVSDDIKVAAALACKAATYINSEMESGNSLSDLSHRLHVLENRKIVATLRDLNTEQLLEVPVSKKATAKSPAFYMKTGKKA